MPLSSAVTRGLDAVKNLSGDENWQAWSEGIDRFVRGAGASYITQENTSSVPDGKDELDGEVGWQLFGKVDEKCRGVLKGKFGGLEIWQALKTKYEKSTMARRFRARRAFYRVHHDPNQPIETYLTDFNNTRSALKSLKIEVDDLEATDVLLMNLDASYGTLRTSIISHSEQTLEQVIDTLSTSVPDSDLSTTNPNPILANAASMLDSSDPYVAMAIRHGLRSGRTGGDQAGSQGGHGRVDEKGFRWCDVTNENNCHRCGRPGHIAALCMYAMPDSIKDWIMSSPHRSHVADTYDAITQPSAQARSATIIHTASTATAQPLSVNANSNYVPPHRRISSRSPSPTFAAACRAMESADDYDEGWGNGPYGGTYEDGNRMLIHN